MKKKPLYIFGGIILVVVFLILAALPHVTNVESLAVENTCMNRLDVYDAYQRLLDDYSLSQVYNDGIVYMVTVRNLFDSCTYYFMPCYIIKTTDIPTAGSPTWDASLYMLTVCTNEKSLAAWLSSAKIDTFELEFVPGSNTFLYAYCYVNDLLQDPQHVMLEKPVDCLKQPQVKVTYTVATASSARDRDEKTSCTFIWSYSLYCCGKEICAIDTSPISVKYEVNT